MLAGACSGQRDEPTAAPAPRTATSTTAARPAAPPVEAVKAATPRAGDATRFVTAADEFTFAIAGEPETLDPGLMRGVNEAAIAFQIFEGLTEYPLGEGDQQPGVATRWTVSPDGLTYTFFLRADARWSNGDPVTAEDFRYSWLRVLDPKLASPYAEMLFPIKGARDLLEGRITDPALVGVEVVDPQTLRVTLDAVAPFFLELTAFHTYRPVHRATVLAHGDRWTRPENIVTNGPFHPVEWTPDQHLKLVRDAQYWDRENVAFARVNILPIQENSTMVTLFEAGQLDWSGTLDLPTIRINELRRRPEYHEDPYHGVYFYRFNVTLDPLRDNKVRRALSMAVDREAILTVIKSGHRAATTFVPSMPGYVSAEPFDTFDPVKARALLAEAGFPGGKGFPRMSVLYNTQENHKRIAEMIQQMWTRDLGIEVGLQNQEWKVYLKSQASLDYAISRSGWIGDYHDPMTFLELWTTGNGNNNTGWSDREFDGLIDRARHEGDPKVRLEQLRQAEGVLLQRGPVLPIYHYALPYLLNPAVKGFAPHLLNLHPVKYMRKA